LDNKFVNLDRKKNKQGIPPGESYAAWLIACLRVDSFTEKAVQEFLTSMFYTAREGRHPRSRTVEVEIIPPETCV